MNLGRLRQGWRVEALALAALLALGATIPAAGQGAGAGSKAPAGKNSPTHRTRGERSGARRNRGGAASRSGLRVVPMRAQNAQPAAQTTRAAQPGAPAPAGQAPAAPTAPGASAGQAPAGPTPGAPAAPAPGGPAPGGPAPGGVAPAAPSDNGMSAGATVTMDFRGSDIANVLKFFAMATNWQVIPDPALTGPVTIISPRPLSLGQAVQVLQSTLEIRGFTGMQEVRGSTTIFKIVPLDRAVQSTTILDDNGTPLSPDDLKNQVLTRVIPIENVDASALARELTPIINKGASLVASTGTNALIVTDTASNVKRIGEMVQALDKAASNNEVQMIKLKNADATDVASAISSLFRQVYTRGRGQQQQPQPGQPQPPAQPGGVIPGSQDRGAVVAVPDTRTNSVLVIASTDNMIRVRKLVDDLDSTEATALFTKVVKMRYADASTVADLINSVLSGSTPSRGGGGGASFASRVFGGFGGFGGYGGGGGQGTPSSDPFAKVVADPRTNSLLVTATKEKMAKIDDLVTELDVNVPTETTTFVIPLKNAQAQDVAYTLGQAFGTSTMGGGGQFGGFGFNIFGGTTNRNQRQNINRRQGGTTNRNNRSVPLGSRAAQIPGAPVAAGPISPDGTHGTLTGDGQFVPDENADPASPVGADSRQYYGGGYGGYGGYGRQMMATPQYGRGMTGAYANLLQLRNNVGVVSDMGSNSLIVTTTPDNITAIRDIISQLDIIPRQVMIEVIIAEATLDSTQKLGFQFDVKGVGRLFGHDITQTGNSNFPIGTSNSTAANIGNPINPGVQYGIQTVSGNFSALVQALKTDNRVHILSTPRVFTSNNQEATVDVTTNVPIVSGGFTSGLGSSVTYDQLPVGITIDVTPRITQDGLVTIDVVASDTELLGFDALQSGVDANGRTVTVQAPRTSERSTDTSVSVHDGEIIALAGLMRDSKNIQVNKVPLLGDIPLLGSLFRSTSTTSNKTELMIFLVPHVVDGTKQTRDLINDQSRDIRKAIPDLEKQQPGFDMNRPLPEDRPQLAPLPQVTPQVTPQTPPQEPQKQP